MTPHNRTPAKAYTADDAHLHYEGGAWVEAAFRLADRWIAWRSGQRRRVRHAALKPATSSGLRQNLRPSDERQFVGV